MKKVLAILALLSLLLTGGEKIWADGFFIEGSIAKIKNKSILIDETWIKVGRKTVIYGEKGDKISLSKLKVNDWVMVEREEGKEGVLAKRIIVIPLSELQKKQALGLELSPEEEKKLLEEGIIKLPEKLDKIMMEIIPR